MILPRLPRYYPAWTSIAAIPIRSRSHRSYSASTATAMGIRADPRDDGSPEYPPIEDLSPYGRIQIRKRQWREALRALPTVEEKMTHMTWLKPDDPGRKPFLTALEPVSKRYGTLALRQHCTRTHVVRALPECVAADLDATAYERLKPFLVEAILMAVDRVPLRGPGEPPLSPLDAKRLLAQRTVYNLFHVINAGMALNTPHLRDAQVDIDPRCEAFWPCGGFNPNKYTRDKREKLLKWVPADEKMDVEFQFIGKPHMLLRTKLPLPEIVPLDDPLCTKSEVPDFPYHPNSVGYKYIRYHPTILPGIWPGDSCEFSHTSIYTREDLLIRREMVGVRDEEECILECGIVSSFASLLGVATYQGFSPYTELTYPLTTHTVVTDGQMWSLFVYQLNTTCLFHQPGHENPRRNVCWASGDMQLYEAVENGQLKGLNDEVLKLLIRICTRPTRERIGVDMRPYLDAEAAAKHSQEHWNLIDTRLSDNYSQRPRRGREVYQWEKFYLFTNSYLTINPRRKRDHKKSILP